MFARLRRKHVWLAVLVGVSGLLVTVGIWHALLARERQVLESRFRFEAEERVAAIRRELTVNLASLDALQALYDASEEVERNEFGVFSQSLFDRHHGVESFGWAPLVVDANRVAHEQGARENGLARYQISRVGPQGEVGSAAQRPEYCPLYFLEPQGAELLAVGLDLRADERFGPAIEQARATGQLNASAPLQLENESGGTPRVLVCAPVYRTDQSPDLITPRSRTFKGVFVAVLNIAGVMEEALTPFKSVGIDISVFDRSLPGGEQLVYAYASSSRQKRFVPVQTPPRIAARAPEYSRTLGMNVRDWIVYCVPTDVYLASWRAWGPMTALTMGLLITGLAVGYVTLLGQQAAYTESLIAQRTAELRESETRFRRAILEAPFPVMLHAEGGDVLMLSHTWSDMTGYAADDLCTVSDWQQRIGDDVSQWSGSDISGLFRLDKRKDEGEYAITTRDNQRRTWHMSSAPLGRLPDGRRLAITMAMDVTDRKQVEEQLLEMHHVLERRVRKRTAELKAMNEVFQRALVCENAQQIAETSLAVAVKLTGSEFGIVGELKADGRLHALAWSAPDRESCSTRDAAFARRLPDGYVRALWDAVIQNDRSLIVNELATFAAHLDASQRPTSATNLLAVPLRYGDNTIGMLVLANRENGYDLTEQRAAETLSVSFVEAWMRKSAEEALRLNESRLDALWRLGRIAESSLKEITDFALEEAVRLTKSELGYLAFMNDDESVLTMHSWSKTAMKQCAIADKPIVYPMETTGLWGEAVRQRKPIITNDYAAPNSKKKGYPEGHVAVKRHMNVPVFDGDRIVAVAGVGNKQDEYEASDVRQLSLLIDGMWKLIQRKRAEDALRKAHDDLESRVQQRTAALASSNTELEQFAYSASHDLQEPLRMISSYVSLLAQRYQGQLDEDADEFIEFAVDGARRMQQLIQDLLAYSRVGTRGKEFKSIDCNSVVDEVIANLAVVISEQGARVTHDELPHVVADRTQLLQLIQNLIGNALKFRTEDPPCVHISAEQSGAEWVFSVKDNGIGIDPKHRDRIFAIFQRLHTRNEYPGTGIGLAICKRIVERHGGRIWVESEPGPGTTFRFALMENGDAS